MPAIMPLIAPRRFILLLKMPITRTGKKDEAAKPKAKATTSATKPGGWMPNHPARHTAKPALIRAARSSSRSLMSGFRQRFKRSCDTADDTTSSKPAAVDKAAARPPAATKAITQLGKPAISGFASTIMSLWTVNSLGTSELGPVY